MISICECRDMAVLEPLSHDCPEVLSPHAVVYVYRDSDLVVGFLHAKISGSSAEISLYGASDALVQKSLLAAAISGLAGKGVGLIKAEGPSAQAYIEAMGFKRDSGDGLFDISSPAYGCGCCREQA